MPRTALIAVLAAMLITTAAGASGSRLRASDPVSAAQRRAAAYWHGTPCGGHVLVVRATPAEAPWAGQNVPGLNGTRAAMWATWRVPGPTPDGAPPATFSDCVVHVNAGVWPGRRAEDARFPAFCKLMLHEYGHFKGLLDAGQRAGTIEYERPELARVPLCERFRLVYGNHVYSGQPRHV